MRKLTNTHGKSDQVFKVLRTEVSVLSYMVLESRTRTIEGSYTCRYSRRPIHGGRGGALFQVKSAL